MISQSICSHGVTGVGKLTRMSDATNRVCLYTGCHWFEETKRLIDATNYANPVYGVATICHQVRCLRWGHPSPFHTATSLLI